MSSKPRLKLPPGHVVGPVLATGSLGVLLAGGLFALGVISRLDGWVAGVVEQAGVRGFPKELPQWSVWLATVVIAYGLAAVILEVPCVWRRLILWVSTVMLVLGWAPVLGLAAHRPEISMPLIAALWSGLCALVYSRNHRMPVDDEASTPLEADAEG
ncbi:MAG: hypothetical protein QM627_09585 [Luteolibacter sp.]